MPTNITIRCPPLSSNKASELIKKDIDSSAFFRETLRYISEVKGEHKTRDVSLFIGDIMQKEELKNDPPSPESFEEKQKLYSVINHSFEQRRVDAAINLQEANDTKKEELQNDPYIRAGYRVVSTLIK